MRSRLFVLLIGSLIFVGGAQAPWNSRVLPEIYRHLELAQQRLESGNWQAAEAHSQLVLLNGALRMYALEANPEMVGFVNQAARNWESHLPGTWFEWVDSREDADILISFPDHLSRAGRDLAGHVRWRRTVRGNEDAGYSWSIKAEIQLRAIRPDGAPMKADAVIQAAMHELGHVLGLADCDARGTLMGSLDLDRPLTKPAPEELEALNGMRFQATLALLNSRAGAATEAAYNATREAD